MNVQEQVGLVIQRYRRAKGLSQEALALRAGIDQAYLSRIENGQADIGMRLLVRLSHGLEMHPSAVLEDLAFDVEDGDQPSPNPK